MAYPWNSGDVLNAVDLNSAIASVFKHGGTGSDGALSITSGTTTLSAGNAMVLEKNYTSISITGTGILAFSNPHTNGTAIFLRSQGNVTLTSSAAYCIDVSNMGATGGSGGTNGNSWSACLAYMPSAASNGGTGAGPGGVTPTVGLNLSQAATTHPLFQKYQNLWVGGGGSQGGDNGGTHSSTRGQGGNGGGALVIECGGAWNFTGNINAGGQVGGNAVLISGFCTTGGGGGGGGGIFICLYNSLTANTGTVNVAGGAGGNSASSGSGYGGGGGGGGASVNGAGGGGGGGSNTGPGGSGANGTYFIGKNTVFA